MSLIFFFGVRIKIFLVSLYFQEIDDVDVNDQRQFMIADSQRELIASHTDSEDAWSDGDTRGTRQLPGIFLQII